MEFASPIDVWYNTCMHIYYNNMLIIAFHDNIIETMYLPKISNTHIHTWRTTTPYRTYYTGNSRKKGVVRRESVKRI